MQSIDLIETHGYGTSKVLVIRACVRYFLSNLYFSPNDSPSKTMKNVFYFI